MIADHLGDFLHRLDFQAQHVAAPAIEQEAYNIRLPAGEDLAQRGVSRVLGMRRRR